MIHPIKRLLPHTGPMMALRGMIAASSVLLAAVLCLSQTPYEGYTFFPAGSKCNLYDINKKLVQSWTCQSTIANNAWLLRDSSVVVSLSDQGEWDSGGYQLGGRIQILTWDGTIVWDYLFRSSTHIPHHHLEPIYRTNNPNEKPSFLLISYTPFGDKITELKPTGATTAEILWEWVATDHTAPTGAGVNKPHLLDLRLGLFYGGEPDWMHANWVSYNRRVDQIIIDVKNFNEILVIDHNITTAQARGHTAGRYGKGGDILYRWGCPANYGVSGTQYFTQQHGGSWISDTMLGTNTPLPGAGNILAIDNLGKKVVEIKPPGNRTGVYPRGTGMAFGPAAPLWSCAVSDLAVNEGSVQRLPNGNTLICTGGANWGVGGSSSRIIEVSPAGQTVWSMSNLKASKAIRYAPGYLRSPAAVKPTSRSGIGNGFISARQDASNGRVLIRFTNKTGDANITIFAFDGRELLKTNARREHFEWDARNQPPGSYVVQVEMGTMLWQQHFVLMH
jgi:hypothetical protein